jgi:hypothetical protein
MRAVHVALTTTLLAWASPPAQGGNISGLPGGLKCADQLNNGVEVCRFVITVGAINAKTVEGIRTLLEYRRNTTRQIVDSTVYLNSPGGSIVDAMAIGRMLRKIGLSASVERGATCASACVYILAAAKSRRIDGLVGIHRPYFGSTKGAEPITSESVSKSYERLLQATRVYLREMNAGTYELVIDPKTNTVYHMLYKSGR